ncbi:13421_t:CDS:2 [Rhizophagus irregularis]|nr:13421_t:CDS:2 [Rhizophagus irregularis]
MKCIVVTSNELRARSATVVTASYALPIAVVNPPNPPLPPIALAPQPPVLPPSPVFNLVDEQDYDKIFHRSGTYDFGRDSVL